MIVSSKLNTISEEIEVNVNNQNLDAYQLDMSNSYLTLKDLNIKDKLHQNRKGKKDSSSLRRNLDDSFFSSERKIYEEQKECP